MSATPMADLRDLSTIVVIAGLVTFDLTSREIRGAQVPIEHVLRSWVTEPGTLFWARHDGFDVTLLENTTLEPIDQYAVQQKLVTAARRVDYVRACRVAVAYDGSSRTIGLRGGVTLVDGKEYPLAVPIALAPAALRAQPPGAV